MFKILAIALDLALFLFVALPMLGLIGACLRDP
jgi:hypothetical protein